MIYLHLLPWSIPLLLSHFLDLDGSPSKLNKYHKYFALRVITQADDFNSGILSYQKTTPK